MLRYLSVRLLVLSFLLLSARGLIAEEVTQASEDVIEKPHSKHSKHHGHGSVNVEQHAEDSNVHAVSSGLWELDPAHTNVTFGVKHLGVSTVRGSFPLISGKLEYNEEDITKSHIEVEIEVASITTGNSKRDDHLKSPDFFDAIKYPQIIFSSKKIEKKGKELKIYGDITIRNITKPAILQVTEYSKPIKDPFGSTRLVGSAKTKILRKDFGLVWNQILEAGGVLVGEEVSLQLDVEFIQAKK